MIKKYLKNQDIVGSTDDSEDLTDSHVSIEYPWGLKLSSMDLPNYWYEVGSILCHPIKDPREFLRHLINICLAPAFDPIDRACVITRSSAEYGRQGSIIIEWEGSPPRYPITLVNNIVQVSGKNLKRDRQWIAEKLVKSFLDEHPANSNECTVWVGPRLHVRRKWS